MFSFLLTVGLDDNDKGTVETKFLGPTSEIKIV